MNVKKNLLTKNDCYKTGKKITPKGMQLHTIGCAQNSASALASNWDRSGTGACVHYCIDAEKEGEVLQFLPDNFRSWGDGGYGNGNLITVELMESDYMKYTGGANFTVTNKTKFIADITRAYNTAVEFFAHKCKEYGWDPQKKLDNGLYTVSSHDEGRRLGLSTAHVDPTHLWGHIGKTMDIFRAEVKAKMNGTSTNASVPNPEPIYRVRKSWSDSNTQIFAGSLEGAKKNCAVGYSVYDENGKEIYSNKVKDTVTITSNQDKIWMGWTKRETNKEGLRGIYGDSGKAYGLQFDYRYGLLDFLQYCVNYNPTRYADFKKFIEYGKGSSKLIYNTELGKLWQKYYDANTEEFEQLQYTCAYINYYEPVKKYIKSYGIDLDKHSPALKGTAWSMSFRSGQQVAAKKFSTCKDSMTDEEIMKVVYGSYGTVDDNRWTKAGQLGDALKALENNTYTIINKTMVSTNMEDAKKEDKEMATTTIKLTAESWLKKVKEWTDIMVADGNWIYSNTNNKTSYKSARSASSRRTNCALMVTHALQYAGLFELNMKMYGKNDGTIVTKNGALDQLKKIGTITHYEKKKLDSQMEFEPGDIVCYYGQHTNIYIGKNSKGKRQWYDAGRGTTVECKENSTWKSFIKTGNVGMYVSNVIRLNFDEDKKPAINTTTKEEVYRVGTSWKDDKCVDQVGAYSILANAKSTADSSAKAKKKTYKVFDSTGKAVYTAEYKTETTTFKPYNVKVKVNNLRIRKSPNGTPIKKNGKDIHTGIGMFGIVDEKKAGNYTWGLLKAYEKNRDGWIALSDEFVKRV